MTLPVADQIRQLSTGGSIVLPQRPLRMVGGILGALAFTAFGVFMIVLGVREARAGGGLTGIVGAIAIGLVCVGFFGVFCLSALVLAMVRPSRLVLTAEGFREEMRRSGRWGTTGTVSWRELVEISITYVPLPRWPGKGRPFLAYVLTDEAVARIHREATARRPGARPKKQPPQRVMMRNGFGSARRLHPLFDAAHQEFGDTSARSGTWR